MRGENYKSAKDEKVFIESTGGNNVRVHSMGYYEEFARVNHIVADFGDNKDQLIVDRNVAAGIVVHGGDGDDFINYTGNGVAEIYGDDGNDDLYGGYGSSTIYGGDGNDTLHGTDGPAVMYGGNGDDTLIGGNFDDLMYGEAGNDTFDGGFRNDALYGDVGNDTLNGGGDNDLLYAGDAATIVLNGGDGNDVLYAGAGNDTLNGGAGDDVLYDEAGNDTIEGGTGNDLFVFVPSYGIDFVTDAGGTDTFDFTAITSAFTVTMGNPTFTDTTMVITSLDGVVTHPGNAIDVFLSGSNGGDDVFYGYAYDGGSIMLDGKAGNDVYNFYGGTGTYTVNDRGATTNTDIVYAPRHNGWRHHDLLPRRLPIQRPARLHHRTHRRRNAGRGNN